MKFYVWKVHVFRYSNEPEKERDFLDYVLVNSGSHGTYYIKDVIMETTRRISVDGYEGRDKEDIQRQAVKEYLNKEYPEFDYNIKGRFTL